MLSAAELSAMRAAQAETFVETCQIERVSRVSDGKGGTNESWAVIATEPCRFAISNKVQRASDGVLRSVTESIITLRWDADVTIADRLVYNGKTHSITGFSDHTWITAKRCVVQEI